eukprot:1153929-Pelagomonas_calceolata.AAC.4
MLYRKKEGAVHCSSRSCTGARLHYITSDVFQGFASRDLLQGGNTVSSISCMPNAPGTLYFSEVEFAATATLLYEFVYVAP